MSFIKNFSKILSTSASKYSIEPSFDYCRRASPKGENADKIIAP